MRWKSTGLKINFMIIIKCNSLFQSTETFKGKVYR